VADQTALPADRSEPRLRHSLLEAGSLRGYLSAIGVTAAATGVGYLMLGWFELSNLIMVYLVGVAFVASRFGPREAILSSVLSVATFDFLFVHPFGTFAVSDTQYVVTFVVMLLVSLMISTLTLRVRYQARIAEERGRHAAEVQRLNEAERMRSTLLTSISHDLRTPLTAIAGAADSLRRGEGDTRALAETIYSESMRLDFQVRNLLDMTRLQWGEVRPRFEWQSVEEIVGSALTRAEDLLRPRKVVARIGHEVGLIKADAALLDRAVSNLLENIARHTPPDCDVEISAGRSNGRVTISVLDTGPGIPVGAEDTLFEQFNQAGGSSKGFGLGLAICHAIVKLHAGNIRAENRSGGGAAFIIELPATDEQPEVPSG
jgi:two-component system, OmpR family, sensor histidine kinase KdpD